MLRFSVLIAVALTGVALSSDPVAAQGAPDWRPPSRQMPAMPAMPDLDGNWQSAVGAWFRGTERVTGVSLSQLRAAGQATPGSSAARVVRFMQGAIPVAVWSDRSGDGRSDMVELHRDGRVVIQVIDANYDGTGDVLRVYEGGRLVREDRL